MVMPFRARQRAFALPAANSAALLFSNSIGDYSIRLGEWFDYVVANYGWIVAGANTVANGDFTTDTSSWTVGGGTLTRDTGQVPTGGGAASGKLASTGTAPYMAPYNPTAGDAAGDATHGNTLAIVPGYWYRASCLMRNPTGNVAASGWLYLDYQIGAGGYVPSTVATCAADSTWRAISCIQQIPGTATEAFLRVQLNDTTSGHFLNVDNVMLERFYTNPTGRPLPIYVPHASRAAISGTNLQNNDSTASNGRGNRAARLDAYAPDIVFIAYSENDLYYTTGAGATTPTTLATWEANVSDVLSNIRTALPNAKIVVLGCFRTTFGFQGAVATASVVNGGNYSVTAGTTAVVSGTSGGTGATVTPVFTGSALTSITVGAGGSGYHVGDAITVSGGTFTVAATGQVATLTNGIPPFGAVDIADAAGKMDAILARQAHNVGALFIPMRNSMTDELVQTPSNVNGKHPTTAGMQQIAGMVIAALDGGY